MPVSIIVKYNRGVKWSFLRLKMSLFLFHFGNLLTIHRIPACRRGRASPSTALGIAMTSSSDVDSEVQFRIVAPFALGGIVVIPADFQPVKNGKRIVEHVVNNTEQF